MAEVTSTPCAGITTAASSGTVGSIQCRRRATSWMRPKAASADSQSTKSGSGSSPAASSAASMERHPGSVMRARRSRPRRAPSIRARADPSSSAASSSRMSSRCRDRASSGASIAASALAASRAASRTGSVAGRRAHSMPNSTPLPEAFSLVRARSCSRAANRKRSTGPTGLTSPEAGAMRPDTPSPGNWAAARIASCSAFDAASLSAHRSPRRCSSPRPRRARPSGPRIQRRSSAASCPDRQAEKALSAASNRWWPSSKTMRFSAAVSPSCFRPRAERAPSKAAWVMTRAWLAITRSARRLARTVFSTKQVR